MAYDFDLFVIGGGSGGVRAARTAAATGASVAIAEESRMGGTCVIRGCVPKKIMVFASAFRDHADLACDFGWDGKFDAFDWTGFRKKLHAELDRLESVYRDLLGKSGVKIYDSRAKLKDANTIVFKNGATVTAKTILIATGGHPVRPGISNAELGLVSNDIFLLEKLPKSILIVGGGYIACEFACILHGLGVDVTMFHRGAQILRGFDDEARGLVAEMMKERGIDLHVGTNIVELAPAAERDASSSSVTQSDATMGAPVGESDNTSKAVARNPKSDTDAKAGCPMWVKATNGQQATFDHVFFATGRKPNTSDLGLEDVGVKTLKDGSIHVDEYSRTSVENIYAIGDVTGRVELTPVAIREGMWFTETVFKDNPTPVDHDLIPSAVFTQPELGTVGMTEDQAAESDEEYEVYCTSFRPMRTAFAGRTDRVLMKLIVEKDGRRVRGCQIVAENAGELIQMIGIAVKAGLTKEDFDRTCAVHPTMSEELVTMRDPVRTA